MNKHLESIDDQLITTLAIDDLPNYKKKNNTQVSKKPSVPRWNDRMSHSLASKPFDQNMENIEASSPRPSHAVTGNVQKLQKMLADLGIGSRREIEELIVQGRISVNGLPAHLGQKISATDQVRMNGHVLKQPTTYAVPRLLLYHKPSGEIVSRHDPENRPTVFKHLPSVKQGRWINVGRLDFNTEGLLLFTTSGELANRLMHPRYQIEREYAVRILGQLDESAKRSLLQGVDIEGGPARFLRMVDGGGKGSNHWYHVVLAEGKNKEIRRMFEAFGFVVSRLIRIRYADFILPRQLKRGYWEEVPFPKVKNLLQKMGIEENTPETCTVDQKKYRQAAQKAHYPDYERPHHFKDYRSDSPPSGKNPSPRKRKWQKV